MCFRALILHATSGTIFFPAVIAGDLPDDDTVHYVALMFLRPNSSPVTDFAHLPLTRLR